MTTLRREAIKTVEDILIPAMSDNPQTQEAIDYAKEYSAQIVDALIELRGFSFLNQQPLSIENAIAIGAPITTEIVERAQLRDLAPRMFEKALGFSKPLPWWNGKEWTAFGEWVCEQYAESKSSFGEYNVWRNTPYTKGGMANTRIRGFVAEFYDSWDMFQMSKGKQTDETRPEYQTIEIDTSNVIPNPNKKPRLA